MIDLVDELLMFAGLVLALLFGNWLLGASVFGAGLALSWFVHGRPH